MNPSKSSRKAERIIALSKDPIDPQDFNAWVFLQWDGSTYENWLPRAPARTNLEVRRMRRQSTHA